MVTILNDIRDGEVSEESQDLLYSRFDKEIEGGVLPTRLYTHNADVDSINLEQLEKLESAPHYYEIKTKGSAKNIEMLLKGSLIQEELELRVGAQVMFIRNNFEKGYVNGSRGTVTGFTDKTNCPIVELFGGGSVIAAPEEWASEIDGKKTASIEQIPLRLAWAITIHKSQGMSLDVAEIDLSRTFEMGQGYVALSRVRSLDGLFLKGFNAMATQIDPLTIRVDERFRELSREHEKATESLSNDQLQENIQNFIERCGGSLEEIDYKDEQSAALQSTYEKTLELLEKHKSLDEIATERSLTVDTVIRHLLVLQLKGERLSLNHLQADSNIVEAVGEAYDELMNSGDDELFAADGQLKLKPIHTMLDGEIEYDDIKFALLFVQNERI